VGCWCFGAGGCGGSGCCLVGKREAGVIGYPLFLCFVSELLL
jgi:hypothetical protein